LLQDYIFRHSNIQIVDPIKQVQTSLEIAGSERSRISAQHA